VPLTTDEKLLVLSREVLKGFEKADGGIHPGFRPAHDAFPVRTAVPGRTLQRRSRLCRFPSRSRKIDRKANESVCQTNCLILDVAMPGMSGPELQRELKLRGQHIPIVFITAKQG
jgi:CheY-like chemotaxis protein